MSCKPQALREKLGELLDEATAISNLAEEEKRDLTDDEKSRTDEIFNLIGKDGDSPTGLYADIARAERLESEISRVNAARTGAAVNPQVSDGPEDDKPKIHAVARKHYGGLKAFKGDNEAAYKAGSFFAAALYGNAKAKQWCSDNGIKAAMSEGANTAGGFLVPEETEQAIINLKESRGVLAQYARVEPMMRETKNIARRTSGFTVYYPGEGGSITASDIGYDQVKLVAKKPAILVLVSSELNEDAMINLGDFIASEIAYGFADAEDKAGFLGDGTSTYGNIDGLISVIAAGSKVTAATGNTAFSTLDLADFEDMVGLLPNYADTENTAWYIHRRGWSESMLRLQTAAGGNTMFDLGRGPERQFLGYPVRFVQVMNSTVAAQTSTDGLCYLGDLSQGVALGRARGVEVAVSTDFKFQNDQLAIRGTQRYDVNVHERGDASNAGSIIMLSTPSS